ncbi:hypothetical protein CYMTET_52442 [Cymbomonas tetramitiformis]|uniref:Synapsin ATP-binding domain-containing protein n=1 Tax=Cymbomonas tetramitiformis TaxID=36881 RepID=A0AAE0EQT1_9CHLO|nr:hypothetical protein CYMTET_52442 [Cymbomonas tetramitiformis]
MRIPHHHDMEDFRSVLALTEGKYCTAEPYIEGSYDLRIQKLGDTIRTFKRTGVSGAWKTNTGTSMCEEIPTTERYTIWATEASKMFGGLAICTVDALCCAKTGQEYILEVNGTSSGLFPAREDEDNQCIKEIAISQLNDYIAAGEL